MLFYGQMARAHYNIGNFGKTKSIIYNQVLGKTDDLNVIYREEVIYLATRYKIKVKDYLAEAKNAAFELDPIIQTEINMLSVKLTLNASI